MLYLSTYISAIKRILPRAVLINLYNKKISKKPFTPEKKKKKFKKITLHGAQAKESLLTYLQSNQVKRTPPECINEFIIQKVNPWLVVDFRLISAFLYV